MNRALPHDHDVMDAGPLMSCREVAERLSISRVTAWRLVRNGQLPGYRVGGQVRVSQVDLENYLRTLPPPLPEEED